MVSATCDPTPNFLEQSAWFTFYCLVGREYRTVCSLTGVTCRACCRACWVCGWRWLLGHQKQEIRDIGESRPQAASEVEEWDMSRSPLRLSPLGLLMCYSNLNWLRWSLILTFPLLKILITVEVYKYICIKMLFVLIANFLSLSLMSLPFCVPVTPRPLPLCFPTQCHYDSFFMGRGSRETLRMRVSSPWSLLPLGTYLKHLNLWRTDSVAHNTGPKFEGCAFVFPLALST